MPTIEDFKKLDIRVGTIIKAEINTKAKNPAYKLVVDLGDLGIKISSAQITELYIPNDLMGKQVLAIVNLPSRQIANTISEILILGTYSKEGVILITPDKKATNGDKLG